MKVARVRIVNRKTGCYQLVYDDARSGRKVAWSTKTKNRKLAEDQREEAQAKLRLGIDPRPKGRKTAGLGSEMLWTDFREEYSRLKLATLREKTASSTENRLNVCERIIKPKLLSEMADPANLERLKAELLIGSEGKDRRSPHTVNSYLAALVALLNFAHKQHWLPQRTPKQEIRADDPSGGRPLTLEEFERMLAFCDKVCGEDSATYQLILWGLWESGLRVGELMNLSWDLPGTIQVVEDRGSFYLQIPGAAQKSRKTELLPVTGGFAELLEGMENRSGYVFNPPKRNGRTGRAAVATVERTISRIGSKTGLKVKDGKTPTAHDLRRSFGQRLADKGVAPRDLQKMMRHSSLTTTEKHYLRDDARDMGQRVNARLYPDTVPNSEATVSASPNRRKPLRAK